MYVLQVHYDDDDNDGVHSRYRMLLQTECAFQSRNASKRRETLHTPFAGIRITGGL